MIIVTGAAGFIGSWYVNKLNSETHQKIVIVDDFSNPTKNKNLENLSFAETVDREQFFNWLKGKENEISFVIHLGARTDTTEFDKAVFDKLNLNYSKKVWEYCTANAIPLIYASSAATYGAGEHGYDDNHEFIPLLKPLNPYGESKNDFDRWVLEQADTPPYWAGLKFFNVYGPNEYHKGRMASVVYHAYKQIKDTGGMKLFKSHHPDYKDGEQLRDFIYVKDVADVIYYLMTNKPQNGIFNLGTGKAGTFLALVKAVFNSLGIETNVDFIPTPEDIRDKYQYFTEAKMSKLRAAGYKKEFHSLEEGVGDYVKNHLAKVQL